MTARAPGWALALAFAPLAVLAAAGAPAVATDPRSVEVLDHDCKSEVGRRAVTLFANGTVRLRDGPPGEERLELLELSPEELAAYLRRLAGEDLSETDVDASSIAGDWVERCTLDLDLPGRPTRNFVLDRYTPPSLALSRVVAIARELGERVERDAASHRRLPADYQPRPGDVLERVDGALYRVLGLTTDGEGVELQGTEQPLTLFVRVEDLGREFVALIPRR